MASGISACILGCQGPQLTAGETAFFAKTNPWGFILFRRNIESPDQVRALTTALRQCVARDDAPILIDQEGGRVQRLGPPHWPAYPPAAAYSRVAANDPLAAREIVRLGARLIAHDLSALGITVDCLPVLDVPSPEGHEVIGDRAYGDTPDIVAAMGRAAAEGLIAGGVLPVVKHIPGHGRAQADSHVHLPIVEAGAEALSQRDFAPFRALSDMPMAMTAHVVYAAIDAAQPATTSRRIIRETIRRDIGFDGLLISDDLSMKALRGDMAERARASLAAGCDVVLHCNGDRAEMEAVVSGVRRLSGRAARRAASALARLPRTCEPLDVGAARARFAAAFEGRWAA